MYDYKYISGRNNGQKAVITYDIKEVPDVVNRGATVVGVELPVVCQQCSLNTLGLDALNGIEHLGVRCHRLKVVVDFVPERHHVHPFSELVTQNT